MAACVASTGVDIITTIGGHSYVSFDDMIMLFDSTQQKASTT